MQYDEFIQRVQQYAGFDNPDEAVLVTAATLETLGERLSRLHQRHLAAQLPDRLKEPLLRSERAERFMPEDFYNRVVSRTRYTFHKAFDAVHAVTRALGEAVAAGELNDILSELPPEYNELFNRASPDIIGPSVIDAHRLFRES